MKKINILLIFIYITSLIITNIFWFKNKNQNETLESNKNNSNSNIAIMVYDKEENKYVKGSNIPTGSYVLNNEKSKCISGGSIGNYNSSNGTISLSFESADQCYLYFDIMKNTPTLAFTSSSPNFSAGSSNRATASYVYDGDGEITCSSNKPDQFTCKVDKETNTITIELEVCDQIKAPLEMTVNAGEGSTSLASTATIAVNVTCLDPDTLVDYWDKKKKKKLKKKVKDIKEGDIVYSYDYKANEIITRKVKKVHINKAKEIYHLYFDNDELKITGNHPLCVDGAGYLEVSQLKVGYKIMGQDGKSYEIKDIKIEVLDHEQDMYCPELDNGSSLTIGEKGLICLSMYVGVSSAMMKSASAIVDPVCDCPSSPYYMVGGC